MPTSKLARLKAWQAEAEASARARLAQGDAARAERMLDDLTDLHLHVKEGPVWEAAADWLWALIPEWHGHPDGEAMFCHTVAGCTAGEIYRRGEAVRAAIDKLAAEEAQEAAGGPNAPEEAQESTEPENGPQEATEAPQEEHVPTPAEVVARMEALRPKSDVRRRPRVKLKPTGPRPRPDRHRPAPVPGTGSTPGPWQEQ